MPFEHVGPIFDLDLPGQFGLALRYAIMRTNTKGMSIKDKAYFEADMESVVERWLHGQEDAFDRITLAVFVKRAHEHQGA